jgi:hypothetical protein
MGCIDLTRFGDRKSFDRRPVETGVVVARVVLISETRVQRTLRRREIIVVVVVRCPRPTDI